jgi:HEAT repeat protein
MYDNMKQMPEAICKVFAGEIRREPDEQMRGRMVYLLGELATAEEVVPLLQILEQDRSAAVQGAAADMLAKLGAAKAIPSLLQKLGAEQPARRDYACRALSAFPTPEVVAALLGRLQDIDETPEVRHQAAHSLGRMRQNEFAGKAKLHQQLDALLQDQSQPMTTRLLAAYALAALGRNSGYELAMANAGNGEAYLRGLAIITLGYIGNYQALPYLTEALQYGNKALRLQAAEALGRLGDAKALPSLYKALTIPVMPSCSGKSIYQ